MKDKNHHNSEKSLLSLAFDISHLSGNTMIDGNSSVITNLATELLKMGEAGRIALKLYGLPSGPVKEISESKVSRVFGSGLIGPAHRVVRYGLPVNLLIDRPSVLLNVASGYQPRFIRNKLISIVHDVAFELDEWRSHYTNELRTFLSVNTALAMRRADGIVAVSNRTREDLISVYGVSPEKVVVIHNGFDRARFNETPTNEDRDLHARIGDNPYFLSVGTLQPRKNYLRLINAFVELKQQFEFDHKLIIVGGKGWLADDIIDAAKRHESNDVVLWGRADQNELPALYRGAFALVFPALYEGFGIPAIEAMASGIPVAGSETGSLGEIIGQYGIQFSPYSEESIGNALKLLLSSSTLVDELKEKSRQRARDFGWNLAAEKYVEFAEFIANS